MKVHTNPDGTTVDIPTSATVGAAVHIGQSALIGPLATIWGGNIRGGTIEGGTIWGGNIRGSRDVVLAGPVGVAPSLLTAVPNEGRDGWLIVGGCSEAIPLSLDDDTDPFAADYPCEGSQAAERLSALGFIRAVCAGRPL